jgi:cytochrome oxidase Cu insertion factor (SCO1/SenC/PrrC family)
MKRALVAVVAAVTVAVRFSMALMAQQPTGPAVGARVPDFEATDQNGQSHTLTSLLGPKGAILVFYRSADW